MGAMIWHAAREYGIGWLVNRGLYSAKLRTLRALPFTERLFEKKTKYPSRIDLFDIDTDALRAALNSLGEEDKQRLTDTADSACRGVINGFSSLGLDYGQPVNWQLDPLTGKSADGAAKWYRIPDFDPERGDIKAIWEASRFSHFVTLARAYLLTGDEKYHAAFSEQLGSWLMENSYSFGANYKCGQECALRMTNALLAYNAFRASGAATSADGSKVKDLTDRCFRRILNNFFYAHKCIKNNHTISELMGMVIGAWCCGEQKILDKAYKLLDKVITEQFSADGGYRQFSFNYQRLALQDIECVLSISEKTGKTLSRGSLDRVRNAALLMYQCQDGSGDMPNYGSNDGALIFPVTSCGYRDFTPVINTAHALTSGKKLFPDGKHDEELIWFGGEKEYYYMPIERVSSQFPYAGLFTIRSGDMWAMTVLNNYRSRPAHLDQLHFDLWAGGVNILCDAGTYSYASDTGRELVGQAAHNTLSVKDRPQMSTHGPFLIYKWTKRKIKQTGDCVFDGTAVSRNGYRHTRKIETVPEGFRITDKAKLKRGADAELLFHTPMRAECEGGEAKLYNEVGALVCTVRSSGGQISAERSLRSLYYLRTEEDTCLRVGIRSGETVVTEIILSGGNAN